MRTRTTIRWLMEDLSKSLVCFAVRRQAISEPGDTRASTEGGRRQRFVAAREATVAVRMGSTGRARCVVPDKSNCAVGGSFQSIEGENIILSHSRVRVVFVSLLAMPSIATKTRCLREKPFDKNEETMPTTTFNSSTNVYFAVAFSSIVFASF